MKIKLSPFTILFLLLNFILIFCASRKIDAENKTPSGLTDTNADSPVSSGDNSDAAANASWKANTKIAVHKISYDIGCMIPETARTDVPSFMEASDNNDFVEESNEQKDEVFYGTFVDTVSKNRTEISSLVQVKIDAIANYSDLVN